MVDSPFQHITEWESKHIYLPSFKELIASEYQELPRGRVVCSTLSNKITIYMDSSLFANEYKEQLKSYFNLTDCKIIWKKDSHYEVYSH
jgi:hypothetical protein